MQFSNNEENDRNDLLAELQQLGYGLLDETRTANADRTRLARAGTTTGYGDSFTFDPVLNKWNIKLDPTTKSIMDAQRGEQLTSLREDAPRNRAAAVRRDDRSQMAEEEFGRAFNKFRFRPQRSEESYIADAQRDSLLARNEGSEKAAADTNRALLRQGRGGDVGSVFKQARDASADEFERTLAGSRERGRANYSSDRARNLQNDESELGFLRGIADDTPQQPVRFGNDADQLTQLMQQATGGVSNAITAGTAATSSATAQLAQILQLLLGQMSK